MRRYLPILSILSILSIPPILHAQEPPPTTAISSRIPRDSLDGISARGRYLAGYDQAAWHGTDAAMLLQPTQEESNLYLARQRDADGRWEVVFGRLSAASDTLFIAFRAVQDADEDTLYHATHLRPADVDTGYYLRAARALTLAREDFPTPSRPYNAVVMPTANGEAWFVYLVPAPVRWGYWPLGGDMRYRVSVDGRTILDRHRMHNAILESGPPAPNQTAEFHTAVVADVVEDTDVFHVLVRTPHRPEYIVSDSYFFRVDTSGQITAWDRAKLGP